MSRRNSREAKARRRAERVVRAGVMDGGEFLRAAAEGQTLPCGCRADDLLHGEWQVDGDPDAIEFLFPRE